MGSGGGSCAPAPCTLPGLCWLGSRPLNPMRAPARSVPPPQLSSLPCTPRYASLYFCCAIEGQDNELITLELIHRYVELLDKYFGSVSAAPWPTPHVPPAAGHVGLGSRGHGAGSDPRVGVVPLLILGEGPG